MQAARALVVDDEPDICELICLTLERMDIASERAGTVDEAERLLRQESFDLCLTDMQLPGRNGLDLVRLVQQQHPELPIAVITAHGSMDAAVEALKAGAFDFVPKPVDLKMLRKLVDSAMKLSRGSLPDPRSRRTLLGDSSPMQRIRGTIVKLARSQAPVYISGESGTGKELVARTIHEKGGRADKAFVPINCGAIPGELMESEFFGHIKGSFTGATTNKEGLFQAADGGTLFLDEVAELPQHMQVKLLRAIQERAIRPVGGQQEITVDVRILSATHKDLAQLVEDGQFRQDLFYRINVIQLNVPSLRERREDIPMLVEHVLTRLAGNNGQTGISLSDDAMQALSRYPFPGNVRELENILERALTMAEEQTITADDLMLPDHEPLSPAPSAPSGAIPEPDDDFLLEDYLEGIERSVITKALEKTNNNKTAAAQLLGISFRALRYKLKKLDLE
ncbi:two-component system response regulator PilR (NtrC family) [Natronocella acetinitrilica]|uniref:Two-component system response regulator PilR (NtrC family) n=1 Tax=Natronocella acetinitrilica TaxID=414046 RepID=A0AAE3FZW4_9GAMM|nr:sigma-54 dependent transcriptional regulator [Natronocella acetinitrilica]MCP1672925.1 two-component system response regulator PilR (NtrC family) [Natronocella acetinitrilica]